jgi:hypothetical protein
MLKILLQILNSLRHSVGTYSGSLIVESIRLEVRTRALSLSQPATARRTLARFALTDNDSSQSSQSNSDGFFGSPSSDM